MKIKKSRAVCIRLEPEIADQLIELANNDQRSIGNYVTRLILEDIKSNYRPLCAAKHECG